MTLRDWKGQYEGFPPPLRRLLELRSFLALGSLSLLLLMLCLGWPIHLLFPPLALLLYVLSSGFILFLRFSKGDYICLRGVCTDVNKTGIRKRLKTITASFDGQTLLIQVSAPVPDIHIGDTVELYLSKQCPIYEQDGNGLILQYDAFRVDRTRPEI